MISTGFGYITFVFAILALYLWLTTKYENSKFLKTVPPLLILYLFFVICRNIGLFSFAEGATVASTKKVMVNYGVPLLVYAVIVQNDPRKILKLGPKMIMTFLVTAASIILGAVLSAMLFGGLMNIPEIPESYGTMVASFIGGPENLFAVADGVGLSENALGNVLILIELAYSPWLIFLMTGVPALYKIFNKFVNAEMDTVIAAGERIVMDDREKRQANVMDVFIVVAVGLVTQMVCRMIGNLVQSAIGWPSGVVMYVLVTIVAMFLGVYTNLGRNPFIKPLATGICLVQVSIGTLGVDLSYFKDAGWMIAGSFTIILIHVIIMIIYAKLSRTDLYTISCASIAAIGGNSSAPVVAGAYSHLSEAYVAIASVMAAFGSIIGTVGGLLITQLLRTIL